MKYLAGKCPYSIVNIVQYSSISIHNGTKWNQMFSFFSFDYRMPIHMQYRRYKDSSTILKSFAGFLEIYIPIPQIHVMRHEILTKKSFLTKQYFLLFYLEWIFLPPFYTDLSNLMWDFRLLTFCTCQFSNETKPKKKS